MNKIKGQRLKSARKMAGLSQAQLGEAVGVDQAFLSRVENGTNEGTVSFWCDAARFLNVSLDQLLALDEPLKSVELRDAGQQFVDPRADIASNYTLPRGLRELAMDDKLTGALDVSDDEWARLAAIPLPKSTAKDGYAQLLLTLRLLSKRR